MKKFIVFTLPDNLELNSFLAGLYHVHKSNLAIIVRIEQ